MTLYCQCTLIFLTSIICMDLEAQIPSELISGKVTYSETKEIDNSLYYIGIAEGNVLLNGSSICNTSINTKTLFILSINKKSFDIEKCWSFVTEGAFSISAMDANHNSVILCGSFTDRISIGRKELLNKEEATYILKLDLNSSHIELDMLSKQFNRISSISISVSNKVAIAGTFYKPGIEILSRKLTKHTSKVQSYIAVCGQDLQPFLTRVLPNAVVHDLFYTSNHITFTGVFFDSTSIDDKQLFSRGYKLFAGKLDEINKCDWLIPLSGESTCSEMYTDISYNELNDNFLVTGIYCGVADFIPTGFNHVFLAKIGKFGNVDWFKRINNMPFRLSTPKIKNLENGNIHLIMQQNEACSIRGYSIQKNESQIIVCEIDQLQILKKISIHKSNYYTPPIKTIVVDEFLDNEDFPNYNISLQMNSVTSKVENQYILTNGSESGYFVLLTVKGVKGFGHAGFLLLKKEDDETDLVTSYALLSSNDKQGINASFGIRETGNAKSDIELYRTGLHFLAGKIDAQITSLLLNSNSSRYFIEVSEAQAIEIIKKVDEITNAQQKHTIYWDDNSIEHNEKFYDQVEQNFRDLGDLIDLKLSSSNEVILPDNPHSMIRSQQWALNYKPIKIKNFDLEYGHITEIIREDGNVEFEYQNNILVLNNGTTIKYLKYEGNSQQGYPNGKGEMKYIILNDLRYQETDSLIYKGSFKDGLFDGRGLVFIRDTSILIEGEFRGGILSKGWRYKYLWSNNRLESKCQYTAGKLDGICQNFFPLLNVSGTSSIEEYSNGIKEGFTYTYYPLSQKIQSKTLFHNGLQEGKKISFFYDGIVYNEEKRTYTDIRTAIRKKNINNTNEYYYANFDPEGFGNLIFHTSDKIDWYQISENTTFENQVFYERIFKFPNGNIHTVRDENSVYQFNNGDILISNYGHRDRFIKEVINHGIVTVPSKHFLSIEELYGDYVLYLHDNSRLTGTIEDGTINGPAKYLTPKNENQSVNVIDGQWSWTFQEKGYSSNFFEKGMQKLQKGVLGVITDIGEGICKFFGKDPEEGEQCGGGIEVGSDGNIQLLDLNGNPVPSNPNPGNDIHIYTISEYTEFDSEVIFDGTIKFIEEAKIRGSTITTYGSPWPGMEFGQAIFPPNGTGLVRKDRLGDGDFLSSRTSNGVKRFHKGIDYKIDAGLIVIAPVSGEVIRISNAYSSDHKGLKAIIISEEGYTAKVLYVNPDANIKKGSKVIAGETILGKSQNLKVKHGPNITNHIHVELYDPKGKIIPPNGKYPLIKN